MSDLDLEAVHTALADQIRAGIADAGRFTIKSHPAASDRPVIEVWPDGDYIDPYGRSGPDDTSDVLLLVRVFLSGANPESEWMTVYRLLSHGTGHDSSIFNAVNADPTLGGVVHDTAIAAHRWTPAEGSIDIPVAIQLC